MEIFFMTYHSPFLSPFFTSFTSNRTLIFIIFFRHSAFPSDSQPDWSQGNCHSSTTGWGKLFFISQIYILTFLSKVAYSFPFHISPGLLFRTTSNIFSNNFTILKQLSDFIFLFYFLIKPHVQSRNECETRSLPKY